MSGACAIRRLDAGVRSSLVGVLVRLSWVVVGDLDRLNIHGKRSLSVVRLTTSPLNSTLGIVGIAAGPDTDFYSHRRLREVGTGYRVGIVQSADDLAIEQPFDAAGGPVDGVGVEGCLRLGDGDSSGSVVGGGIALAEVVGFDGGRVGADLFLVGVSDRTGRL